jgi:hypothetical protein
VANKIKFKKQQNEMDCAPSYIEMISNFYSKNIAINNMKWKIIICFFLFSCKAVDKKNYILKEGERIHKMYSYNGSISLGRFDKIYTLTTKEELLSKTSLREIKKSIKIVETEIAKLPDSSIVKYQDEVAKRIDSFYFNKNKIYFFKKNKLSKKDRN